MFNICRVDKPPVLDNISSYNHPMVVSYLKRMYTKCHICNQELTAGITIEHILPKEHNDHLFKEWSNLILCCNRCNTIKGHKQDSVIDVTNCTFDIPSKINYSVSGEMSSDDKLIDTTIEVYDLNRLDLKRKRRRVLLEAVKNKEVILTKNSEFRGMLLSMRKILEKNGVIYNEKN